MKISSVVEIHKGNQGVFKKKEEKTFINKDFNLFNSKNV